MDDLKKIKLNNIYKEKINYLKLMFFLLKYVVWLGNIVWYDLYIFIISWVNDFDE